MLKFLFHDKHVKCQHQTNYKHRSAPDKLSAHGPYLELGLPLFSSPWNIFVEVMVACLGLLRRDPVTSTTALLAESVLHTAKLQDYAKKNRAFWPTTPRKAWTAHMHLGQNCKHDYVNGSLINQSDWSRILLAVRLIWPIECVESDADWLTMHLLPKSWLQTQLLQRS